MKTGTGSAIRCIYASAQALLVAVPVPLSSVQSKRRPSSAEARTQRVLGNRHRIVFETSPASVRLDLVRVRAQRTLDVEAHLFEVAKRQRSLRPAETLLEEGFEKLDPARWIVLGQPRVVAGRLETSVPGGWDNRCGIATREALPLEDTRPLVVEFTLTPLKMGIDSQIFASATETGIDSYRFSFYGPVNHFGVYTRSERELQGPWLNRNAGWCLRAESGPIEPNQKYRVRAEIRRGDIPRRGPYERRQCVGCTPLGQRQHPDGSPLRDAAALCRRRAGKQYRGVPVGTNRHPAAVAHLFGHCAMRKPTIISTQLESNSQ